MVRLTGWQRTLYARCSEAVRASLLADTSSRGATLRFSLQLLRQLLCHPTLANRCLQESTAKWPLASQLLLLFEAQDLSMLKRDQLLALRKSQVEPPAGADGVDDLSSKLCVLRCLLTGIWAKANEDKIVIFSHSVNVLCRIKRMLRNMGEGSVALDSRVSFARNQVAAHVC